MSKTFTKSGRELVMKNLMGLTSATLTEVGLLQKIENTVESLAELEPYEGEILEYRTVKTAWVKDLTAYDLNVDPDTLVHIVERFREPLLQYWPGYTRRPYTPGEAAEYTWEFDGQGEIELIAATLVSGDIHVAQCPFGRERYISQGGFMTVSGIEIVIE